MIKIYGKPACAWCLKAKKLAERYGLEYEYVDIQYTENYNELKEKLSDVTTVPQIWWRDKHIGGYEEFAAEIENTIGGFGDGKF
jgi:glutaredoxin 1